MVLGSPVRTRGVAASPADARRSATCWTISLVRRVTSAINSGTAQISTGSPPLRTSTVVPAGQGRAAISPATALRPGEKSTARSIFIALRYLFYLLKLITRRLGEDEFFRCDIARV